MRERSKTNLLRFDRKSGGPKRFKQEIKYKFDSNRLLNVGDHFPWKGVGTDHTFVVCREKKKRWIIIGRECPSIQGTQISTCVRINLLGRRQATL